MRSSLILVVDDEQDFRAIVSHVLRCGGYEVVTAADGAEGLRRFDENEPDLVVLDGQLPDIDGFEVCRRIRATRRGAGVPIIMCTVRSALSTVAAGFDAGATGYVLKPFEMEELLDSVAEALKKAAPGGMSRVIAVVDDDEEMRALLALVLGKAGFKVSGYATPGRFFDGIVRSKPALCIVDVQLPGMDGREVVRVLRSNPETRALPVIMVTAAATSSEDVVRGVENGADEYFPKPLELDLLVARINNLLSRANRDASPAQESISWGELEVAPDEHRVTVRGKDVPLTHLEFKLLIAFLRQPSRVLPRSWLLQNVWDSTASVSTRTVDKHVETLRRKVPALSGRLETVVGVGYLFRP